MIFLCNFADHRMGHSQIVNTNSALKNGVDQVLNYSPAKIGSEFIEFNKETINAERGPSYWLWKPYIVWRALQHCKDGDVLIYSDAGVEFVSNVKAVADTMTEDIHFFSNGWPHNEWCKVDVMEAILPESNYYDLRSESKQVQASLIFFKVNDVTRAFVKEWLLWCQMPGFIDDSPSKLINYATFAEHRHDQAILCCLQIKYGYKLHWYPATTAMHIKAEYKDAYPVLINHHRKRNHEW